MRRSGRAWRDQASPEVDPAQRETVRVRCQRFDDWRRAARVEDIALMIDVEGAEDRVVAGMTDTLRDAPPAHIICETTRATAAHRMLVDHGYTATELERSGELVNLLYSRSVQR